MANVDTATIQSLLAPQTQLLQAIATRPQRTSVTTSSQPYALADALLAKQRIDQATQGRDGLGYSLASALSEIPQQQGYGTWLSDFGRAFGAGLKGSTDDDLARAQKDYENALKLGDVKTQEIDYTPMEYGTSSKAKQGNSGTGATESLGGVQANNFGRSVGYDPVKNLPDFGPITRGALSEEELGVLKYIPGVQSLAKGITDKTATQLQSTWSDISDNILSGKVLDFVGKAGGIRIADTPAEQEFIFGPIRNYKNMSKDQLSQALAQSRNNFVTIGLKNAKEQKVDVSSQELKDWWNSAFSVPKGLETDTMYNIQDNPETVSNSKQKNTVFSGEIVNGFRFKGGDPNKQENWEKVK